MLRDAAPRSLHAHPRTRSRGQARACAGASLLCASALLLTACGREEAGSNQAGPTAQNVPQPDTVVFVAGPRDRLCLKNGQAAVITYAAAGSANCTLRGTVTDGRIHPEGDTACTVPLTRAGDRATLGSSSPSCAYYCGPGASFAGKSFTRLPTPEPVTDFAGDPLC